MTTANTIRIADRSITFTCAQDNHQSTHPYPRPTDPASDVDLAVLSTPTATQITVNVGTSSNSTGGTLEFTIVGGGSGYTNPVINIPDPSYGDLPIEGINRLGIGATTETGKGLSVDCIVGSAATVGFGTTCLVLLTMHSPDQDLPSRKVISLNQLVWLRLRELQLDMKNLL